MLGEGCGMVSWELFCNGYCILFNLQGDVRNGKSHPANDPETQLATIQ